MGDDMMRDLATYGVHISKDGQRIPPEDFYLDPRDALLDEMAVALRVFMGAAFPVAPEINPRGHNWSEAYLDQALERARATLSRYNQLGK